jgi:hypothetical protein
MLRASGVLGGDVGDSCGLIAVEWTLQDRCRVQCLDAELDRFGLSVRYLAGSDAPALVAPAD